MQMKGENTHDITVRQTEILLANAHNSIPSRVYCAVRGVAQYVHHGRQSNTASVQANLKPRQQTHQV